MQGVGRVPAGNTENIFERASPNFETEDLK